jgi:polyhydroxyalkanoate synthase
LNELTGQSRINLLGVCQGGTFALCHACIQPWRIKRLGLLVTPVDFHSGDSLIRHWSRWVDFEKLARYPVNIPGRLITLMFQLARPFDDLSRQVRLINQPVSEHGLDFMRRMDHWVYDCPDQPGRAFAQFMQWMYQDNALVSGTLTLGNVDVDLARVDFPVMNVYAENDHLVPPESSAALRGLINTDCYNEMRFCGGHVGLMVSARAQRDLLPELGRWLSASRDQG